MSGVHVSVVLAVHNGDRYVEEAVRSVLGQTHRDLDLIVVDDGSTDRTAEIVTGVDDGRVRLIRQENAGVAPARNRGIEAAEGDFVAFIDHDDLWFPEKISTQLSYFDRADVGLVGSRMVYLSDRGPTRATAGEEVAGKLGQIAAGRLMPFPLSSVLVRAELLQGLGGFDTGLAGVAQVEDLDLVARAARIGLIGSVPRSLGYYRIHGGAASFRTFHRMRRGTRFLRARIAARDAGQTLTWEQWSARAVETQAQRRIDRANFLYRSAGLDIVSGHRMRGAMRLAGAAGCSPTYVLGRLRKQLLPHLAPSGSRPVHDHTEIDESKGVP